MATRRTRRRNTSDDPVTKYAKDVVAGRIVAGPHVRNTCKRHLRDLKEGPKRGLTWDLDAALRAINFFPDVLRLAGGQFEGKPFHLASSQAFVVGSLFGWKRKNGYRRFTRAYMEEGKGNGKSPLAAGIGMYGLVADKEMRAEIYAAASSKDQAMILFRDAVAMREQSPALTERIKTSGVQPVWNLAFTKTGSFFRPISAETKTSGQSGPRPHFALVDELHEHRDGIVLDMLERGFKWRRQPLLFVTTNSGSDRQSVCFQEHTHAIRVAAGDVEDDSTFSYVCALDKGDDPLEDPSCWIKVNPLLGVTITEEYLAGVAAQAKAIPGRRNNILRLHFCVWTDADTAWIERELWEGIEDDTLDLDDFHGLRAWAGLDLGATRDPSAKALLVEDGETEDGKPCFALFVTVYFPADGLEQRALDDQTPYDVWADQGHITPTPGKVSRIDYIAADLIEDGQNFDLQHVAYDRWLIKRLEQELDELGVELPLVEHPQGFTARKDSPLRMPDSINSIEELILEGRMRVAVNPALRSAVMSARMDESPAGLRRFTKSKSTARIDAAVAAAMAVGAATTEIDPQKREIEYEEGDMFAGEAE